MPAQPVCDLLGSVAGRGAEVGTKPANITCTALVFFFEVTYALDSVARATDNVGFGTWVRRGREFNSYSFSSGSHRTDRQSASRPHRCLTNQPSPLDSLRLWMIRQVRHPFTS